ncbi:hypothetical protein ANO14919_085400 [Xylariales sp. No.14919]|nr:hypothetical protein ANO14919_085400 [Xylariales sp. No.14919]
MSSAVGYCSLLAINKANVDLHITLEIPSVKDIPA